MKGLVLNLKILYQITFKFKNSTNINSDLEFDSMHFQYDVHKIPSDSITKNSK